MRHTRIEARHERHEALAAAPLPRSVRQGSFVVRRQSVKSEEQDALQVGHPRMLLGRRPEVAQSLDLRRFAQPLNGVRGGGRCRSSHMLTHTRNARHDAVVQHDAQSPSTGAAIAWTEAWPTQPAVQRPLNRRKVGGGQEAERPRPSPPQKKPRVTTINQSGRCKQQKWPDAMGAHYDAIYKQKFFRELSFCTSVGQIMLVCPTADVRRRPDSDVAETCTTLTTDSTPGM